MDIGLAINKMFGKTFITNEVARLYDC